MGGRVLWSNQTNQPETVIPRHAIDWSGESPERNEAPRTREPLSSRAFRGFESRPLRQGDTLMSEALSEKELPGGVVHDLPADLKKALTSDAKALETWEDITPLARNEWICWIEFG